VDELVVLLSKLFENNNVAGIIISICLLLTLLSNIGFFSFIKKILKFNYDIFYAMYWNHQRKLLNKPITEKQRKLQKEIKDFLKQNNFLESSENKTYFYNENLPGLNEAIGIDIGKTHSHILTKEKSILTSTGPIDNQNIDNRYLIQLINDLKEKGPNGLNRSDYLMQQEDIKEPRICKGCKFFVCSGWNH
jgi:hypothetical protein